MFNSQPAPLRFPQDTLRFLYWVFFKPITLHNYIYKIAPSLRGNDDPSLFIMWRRRKEHPEFLPIIKLSFINILVILLLAFPLAGFFQLTGFEVNWYGVAEGVAVGVVYGVVLLGVVLGVAVGVSFILSYYRIPLFLLQVPWAWVHKLLYRGANRFSYYVG